MIFIKGLSHQVSEVPLYSRIYFFPPHQRKILISVFTQAPVGGVEIIENTLFSLSLTQVCIRSSSSNF